MGASPCVRGDSLYTHTVGTDVWPAECDAGELPPGGRGDRQAGVVAASVLRKGGVPPRRPPSMVRVVPVMKPLSDEASQMTAEATSSTVPMRPSGTAAT